MQSKYALIVDSVFCLIFCIFMNLDLHQDPEKEIGQGQEKKTDLIPGQEDEKGQGQENERGQGQDERGQERDKEMGQDQGAKIKGSINQSIRSFIDSTRLCFDAIEMNVPKIQRIF